MLDLSQLPIGLALLNVCLLCILTVPHEFAHAWVATKLGDRTPEEDGRVTLYPPAHIDPLGTLILPAVTTLFGAGILGWGRPVSTDPRQLRGGLNGLAIVALAGPASNIVLAVLLAVIAIVAAKLYPPIAEFAVRAVRLSLYLAIFNLLPVPPLDGSKLLLAMRLPVAIYSEMARAGFFILIILMSVTNLGMWMHNTSLWGTEVIFRLFY